MHWGEQLSATALSQPVQEEEDSEEQLFELLERMISRDRKLVWLCDKFGTGVLFWLHGQLTNNLSVHSPNISRLPQLVSPLPGLQLSLSSSGPGIPSYPLHPIYLLSHVVDSCSRLLDIWRDATEEASHILQPRPLSV